MFQVLRNKAKAVKRLNEKQLLKLLFLDRAIKNLIIEYNTDNQLYEQGIDADGESLGEYSLKTIAIKISKGQPTDRVPLKDTGDFYKSFRVVAGKDSFEITANTVKDDSDLIETYGESIIGLTDESKAELIFNLLPLLIHEAKKKLEI